MLRLPGPINVGALAVVIALAGQASAGSPPVKAGTGSVVRLPASHSFTSRSSGPAVVPVSEVASPLRLRVFRVARYCAASFGTRLLVCRPGQRPVIPQLRRLLQLSVIARRAAGRRSWYAWNLEMRACRAASAGGHTVGGVRAGTRLRFDVLVPPRCRGRVLASVSYFTEASTRDAENAAEVGRRTFYLG